MILADKIIRLRKKNGWSQEELAEKMGVSRQAVSRWEMDGAVPDVDKLIAMSKLFSVTLNDLLGVEAPGGGTETLEAEQAAPQIVITPVKSSRWNTLLSVLLCLCLLLTGFTATQLRLADRRLTRLEHQGAVITALDPNAPLAAAAEFQWSDSTLSVTLTAAQMVPDLKVTLQAVDQEGNTSAKEMKLQGGSIWQRSVSINPWNVPITVSAVFNDGKGGSYTQALFRITSIDENSCSWDSLWE